MPGDTAAPFYDGLADDYHLIYGDWHRAVQRQGAALDRLIRGELGQGPHAILDCACGIGTQALGLAALGHRVHATDISPAAVERARREAAAQGVAVTLGVADMRDLGAAVPGGYDVVVCCDNALPHLLEDTDLLRAARAMRGRLRPDGLLLASIRDYDAALTTRPRATVPQVMDGPDGRRLVFQVWDWDADGGDLYGLSLFVVRERDGRWETACHRSRYRALRRRGLGALLEGAGFLDVRWRMPEETGFFQPVVTARAG